jgi:hypothetical protein
MNSLFEHDFIDVFMEMFFFICIKIVESEEEIIFKSLFNSTGYFSLTHLFRTHYLTLTFAVDV